MYKCKIEQFEGPLDLLLHLIEKEELNISEISLSRIADQYVEYVNVCRSESENINASEISDFLLIAAKLLLAKSRYLLPFLNTDDDEDLCDLEQRLKIYKEFLDASKRIDELYGSGNVGYAPARARRLVADDDADRTRKRGWDTDMKYYSVFCPPSKISKSDLKNAFEEIINNFKSVEKLEEEQIKRGVSVQDKLDEIKNFVLKQIKMDFNSLILDSKDKGEVIVSFLAILELVKQRVVFVEQSGEFNDIIIRRVI
ncbi:segregation and condensation protein A [Patescibacteria group bacterium]